MDVLIYKRTHRGDPDDTGLFGIHDCMGKVREFLDDKPDAAVIGIGGIGWKAGNERIAERINWVGIGPERAGYNEKQRAAQYRFRYFVLKDEDGPPFESMAPVLTERMYGKNTRHVRSGYQPEEMAEIERILDWARQEAGEDGFFVSDSARESLSKLNRDSACNALCPHRCTDHDENCGCGKKT